MNMTRIDTYEGEFNELLDLSSKAKQVFAAVNWVRVKRMKTFLKALQDDESQLSQSDRARFEAYVNSDMGRDFLADYADTILRTRSERAIAALAILFSDYKHSTYTQEFKAAAALALDGISERVIDAFLLLMAHRSELNVIGDTPYRLYSLSGDDDPMPAGLAAWSRDGEEWVVAIDDLVARHILRGDPNTGMRTASLAAWWCKFGVGTSTEQFATLLTRAHDDLRGREVP
jgi:hypothetical protein